MSRGLVDEHKRLYVVLQQCAIRLNLAREEFRVAKAEYQEADREIAMSTRIILPPAGTTKRKPKKPRDFSKEEIQQIADRLNITLKPKEE